MNKLRYLVFFGIIMLSILMSDTGKILSISRKRNTYINETMFPYIKRGYLYTKFNKIPIKNVTSIELVRNKKGINFVIIKYRLNRYKYGAVAMSYTDFIKIMFELQEKL